MASRPDLAHSGSPALAGATTTAATVVTAVIVTYRTPEALASCLESLGRQTRPPDEIVVVDNGVSEAAASTDGADREGVAVLQPSANIGFGAGCNLGSRAARGDLLLLNADVVLTDDALERMVARLESYPDAAAVGPRVLARGRTQPSARSFPRLRTGLIGRRSPLTELLARWGRQPAELRPAHGDAGLVDWISGACMLVRRDAFEQVGGFDEGYWMYWEDADLCRRLAQTGWTVHFEPEAVVHHATGASGTSERTVRAFHDSAIRFADRYLARNGVQRWLFKALLRGREIAAVRVFRLVHGRR